MKFIFIFISSFLLLFFFIRPVHAQKNLQISDLSCDASDSASLKNCLQQVKKDGFPLIKIIKTIDCHHKEDCEFTIDNSTSKTIITSSVGSDKSAFKRSSPDSDFDYSIFNIKTSQNINLNNLTFDEGDGSVCKNQICLPTINITNSQGVYIDHIKIFGAKEAGVKLENSGQTGVSNSDFNGSAKNAIQVTSTDFVNGVLLDRNSFENNGSSAVEFSAKNTGLIPSVIRNNIFHNNHYRGVYGNCTYPCNAPQLLINNGAQNVKITGNTITDGYSELLDLFGLYISGVEVSAINTKNIEISCNNISKNKGSGIVQTGFTGGTSNFSIKENKIYDNGFNVNVSKALVASNCFYKGCSTSCSQ